MKDNCGREIDYIRISVTDRCNFRCGYCMPPDGVKELSHGDVLTYEEIVQIVKEMTKLGIKNVKITGGEPLVRKGICTLINALKEIPGIEDITLTTNGYLLRDMADALKAAGISTVNVSLDTLDRNKFMNITKTDGLLKVLSGIDAALETGMAVKLNCTLSDAVTDSDILSLAEFSGEKNIPLRFIEMMPIGCAKLIASRDSADILTLLKIKYGQPEKDDYRGHGPAEYYSVRTAGGNKITVGIIGAVHHKFCSRCNRIRLTADGFLKPCLAYNDGVDLRNIIRNESKDSLYDSIKQALLHKPLEHRFEDMQVKEVRNMNQIGG